MDKRHFIGAALGAATLPAFAQGTAQRRARGPALLTVTGAGVRANRGALDPVRDQMMVKQKIAFGAAHAFDFAAIAGMPAVTIRPTLEYDSQRHRLSGPLLLDVLKAAGLGSTQGKLAMRAVDGYAPVVSVADAAKYRFILATHLDGRPMPLGGLGPFWAVYEPDAFPELAARPLPQRFENCPWGLFFIEAS